MTSDPHQELNDAQRDLAIARAERDQAYSGLLMMAARYEHRDYSAWSPALVAAYDRAARWRDSRGKT